MSASPPSASNSVRNRIADRARSRIRRSGAWLRARLLERSRWILAAALISLGPTGLLASRLELDSSFLALLSPSDPEAAALFGVLDRTGGLGFSTILVPAGDRPRAERVVDALQHALGDLPDVRWVDGRVDVDALELGAIHRLSPDEVRTLASDAKAAVDHEIRSRAGLLLEDEPRPTGALDRLAELRDRRRREFEPYHSGSDGAYLYVFVALAGSVAELGPAVARQAELERVAREVAASVEPSIALAFSGPIVNRRQDAAVLRSDLARAAMVGAVAVLALLVGFFRRWRTVALVLVPLALGLVWTLAFARLVVGHLNVLSGFLLSILTGLGVEHGIHLARRLADERRSGASVHRAVRVVLGRTAPSVLSSSLVNASVFAVVAVAGFRGLVEFGLLAATGTLLTAVAAVLVLPLAWLELERLAPDVAIEPRPARPMALGAGVRVALALGMAMLALSSIASLARGGLRFRADWRELGADTESSRLDRYVMSTLATSTSQLVLALDDPSDLPRARAVIAELGALRLAQGRSAPIERVLAIDDLVATPNAERTAATSQLAHQLARVRPAWLASDAERESLAHALRLARAPAPSLSTLPDSLVRRLRTRDDRGTVAVLETSALLEDSRAVIAWSDEVAELRRRLEVAGVRGALASENAVAGRIFQLVLGSGPRVLLATLAVLFAWLVVVERRVGRALGIVASVAVGLLLTLGLSARWGPPINFMNAAILPIVLGVSVDNAIHLADRFDEVGLTGFAIAWRQTGAAALAASLTNLAGFASLFVAHSAGLRSVASLSAIGIAATLTTTTLLYPMALEQLARARARLRTSRR